MKTLLITFGVLLVILTLISAFGGSLTRERFEEESMPSVYTEEEMPASTENFWEEQQKSMLEAFTENKEQEQEQEQEQPLMHTAEHSQDNMEQFASCGYQKETFTNSELDIEPFEEEKTYGAY
jgi:hypothetical protein